MKKVIAFGAFDPLHEGHVDYLRQAKALGGHLLVVVAHDGAIRANKGYEPHESEEVRMERVRALDFVDEVVLGNKSAHPYAVLGEHDFDIVALGFDQAPSDEVVRRELDNRGKNAVEIVRLQPYEPHEYKSSYVQGGLE